MSGTNKKTSNTSVILVVDEDVLTRHAVSEYLRACGHYVIETANTGEAMTVLETGPRIGIILADATSCGVDPQDASGFELASWVNRNRPDVRMILVSTLTTKSNILREICTGPDGVHTPPFDLNQRIQALRAERKTRPPSTRRRIGEA
jgi:CheY-like chemotaxis protein